MSVIPATGQNDKNKKPSTVKVESMNTCYAEVSLKDTAPRKWSDLPPKNWSSYNVSKRTNRKGE